MSEQSDALLQALLMTVGRGAFSIEAIHGIINPKGNNLRNVRAYNLADGTRTQSEIVKQQKLDTGNFSRAVSRWIEAGIMFRLPNGTLLHIYPVPEKL